jgi:HlyD family type I secretion membrane fusion protein
MNFAGLKATLTRPKAWWPGRGVAAAPGGVAVATASRLHLTVGLDDDQANERAGAPMLDAAAQRVPLAKVAMAKMAVDQATFDRRQQEIAAYNADHAGGGKGGGKAGATASADKDGAAPMLDKALPVRRRASDLPAPLKPQALARHARPPLDLQMPVMWGLAVLVLGSLGFITWAATAPLAEGVPAEGYVKVETNRKPVQHLRGGVVDEILVRDGEHVAAGQVLMRLNDSDVKSRSAVIESRMMSALALQARLLAERQGARELVFPAELRDAPEQSAATDAMRTQQQLFGARRSGLYTDVAMQESNASSLETYIRGLRAQADAKTEQIRLLQVELDSLRELAAQGYVPRARVSDIERQIALLQGQRAEDMGNVGRVKGSVSESRMKIQQRRTESTKDVETQLTEVQSRVNELREQRASLRDELDRTLVKAPSEGVVVDLAVHSVGAVINPSQRILDVVPAREPLIVEAQVPARLFDNLHTGMACDVRFTGPDQSVTRPVKGHVSYIAADRSIDAARGESFFVTRVQITDQALAEAGLKVMQPGMPATVMIPTAHRSLLHYLVAPLGKRLPGALSER